MDFSIPPLHLPSVWRDVHPSAVSVMYIISLPIVVSCYLTMPDVGKPRWRPWYPATFLVATLWIALYSYLMVWMITVIGEHEQIIMGGFVPIKVPLGLISIR